MFRMSPIGCPCHLRRKENDMDFVLFFDLYEDWKELTFAKEYLENAVKELKQATKGGVE